MRYALRWWETLGRAERIVAMSLATGGAVAIVNSTVWAIAVSYMAREKERARVAAAAYASRGVGGAAVAVAGGPSAPDGDGDENEQFTGPSRTGLPAHRR